jgi:hypothetical protein
LRAVCDAPNACGEDRCPFGDVLAMFPALLRWPREDVTPVLEARPEERQDPQEGGAHRREMGEAFQATAQRRRD